MKVLRRAVVALGMAGIVGWALRLRGRAEVPPTSGGWRQLSGPDYR